MNVLTTLDVSFGWSTFIIICLSARPFSGSVSEADAPTVCFLPSLAHSASSHYCLFLQVVSQHLGFLIFLASNSCLIWVFTWGVRFWGSFWGSMSLTSLKVVPKCSGSLWLIFSIWKFPRELLRLSFRPIFSVIFSPVAGLLSSSALVWCFSSWYCLYQKVPWFLGALKLSEGLLCACERCPGK